MKIDGTPEVEMVDDPIYAETPYGHIDHLPYRVQIAKNGNILYRAITDKNGKVACECNGIIRAVEGCLLDHYQMSEEHEKSRKEVGYTTDEIKAGDILTAPVYGCARAGLIRLGKKLNR